MEIKQYLLKLMTALEDKWSMAKGLKVLIENNIMNDQSLEALQQIIAEAIKEVNSDQVQQSLLKAQEFLKRLHEKEIQEQPTDEELDKLLDSI